jgi:Flp pilus assembly protein TadG
MQPRRAHPVAILLGHRRRDREGGQILVLFTAAIVLIMVLASIVIDVGLLRTDAARLQNALDAGALAAGQQLPATSSNVSTVKATAVNFATNNYAGLNAPSVALSCLIGLDTATGLPRVSDMPTVCNVSFAASSSQWRCTSTICWAPCDPAAVSTDVCNTVQLTDAATQEYGFGRVVGINEGNTGNRTSAACTGQCGSPPTNPVDVVLIMDRTQSMSGTDTTNALSAANAVRKGYNPSVQWLALSLLGPSNTGSTCLVTPASSIGTANAPGDVGRWVPVGFSGVGAPINQDYTQGGSTLAASLKTSCYANSSTRTDIADPVSMAAYYLQHNGRAGVRKGIILETDGQPNTGVSGSSSNYCNNANVAATAAKNAGIEVFTIGFGLDGSNDAACPDGSGAFKGKTATYLLASMATQPSSNQYGCPGSGSTNSNSDDDHFFCVPKSSGASTDLSVVFQAAAAQLAKGTRLIQLYPLPVVSGVSPNTNGDTSGGTVVTISGKYFTDAYSVTFGGSSASSFSVVSDTQITAVAPAGTSLSTVDVQVSTPGGSSTLGSGDRFRYGP